MKDLWTEIFIAIRANKLRTCLTGFSIAWGIFMLIILLASGNGLRNGMLSNFNYMSNNTISFYPGVTSKPYRGWQSGRDIRFSTSDLEFFKQQIPQMVEMTDFSPIFNLWSSSISYGDTYASETLSGVCPGYDKMRNMYVISGRLLDESDERECRKVIILHPKTAETLFKDKDPIGKYVNLQGLLFKVVGIYDIKGGSGWNKSYYIPFSTSQKIFNPGGYITDLTFAISGIENAAQSEELSNKLRRMLSARMQFDPDDKNAMYIEDRMSSFEQSQVVFNGISLFIWIIGIGTLIAGIVGISNIMLITVKERTREFGIRKALGATPSSIIKLVVLESLTITLLFGYIGMLLGVALTETVAKVMSSMPVESGDHNMNMFMNPTVNLDVAIAAMAILVLAGVIAGYVPAHKAVKIKPIEAMQAK